MLSLRQMVTNRGELPVAVLYPQAVLARRLALRLTLLAAILCAVVSGTAATVEQNAAYHRGEVTLLDAGLNVAGETLVKTAAGATAVFIGMTAYNALGGLNGLVLAMSAAAVAGLGIGVGAPYVAGRLTSVPAESAPKPDSGINGAPDPSGASPGKVLMSTGDIPPEREKRPDIPQFKGPWNDDVVYVGMNRGASTTAVRKLSRRARVTLITDGAQQDKVRVGSRVYDLRSNAGITGFANSLRLSAAQSEGVTNALKSCEKSARDELAQLALVWQRAEHGRNIPSRLVLAGHSNGDGVWGDNNGSLRLGPLHELARAMPRAASQVEDAFVTGCYSGGEVTMEQYRLILPQVKTIWAYEAQAPGVDNGGAMDQAGWEAATRGRSNDVLPRKNSKVRTDMAVWTKSRGYVAVKPPLDLDQFRGKVEWLQKNFFSPAFWGRTTTRVDGWTIPIEITDAQTGLVRQYYSWLVRLTQRKDLPDYERPMWTARKHQTIRLLYYNSTVAPHFARHYAPAIRSGYAAVGMRPPDYGRLRRGQALAHIHAFGVRLKKTPHARPEAKELVRLLQRGLRDLDPALIPDGWV